MNTWETQLEILFEQQAAIDAGDPIETYVFDKESYEQVYVKAVISKDPMKLPGGDVLWVRDLKGKLFPQPWAIKIIERQSPPWLR